MKKRILGALAIMIIASVSSSIAATGISTGGTLATGTGDTLNGVVATGQTSGGSVIGRLSKNVHFGVNFDTTGYSITTFCAGGTKMYGTGQNATAIYSKDATAIAAPGNISATTAFATGWTAM